jgi:23S rRNA pseudouridine1911/1915/1917 synthase
VTEQTYTLPSHVRPARADKILAQAFPEHSRVAFHRSFDSGLVLMAGKPIPRDQSVAGDAVITFSFPDLIPSSVRAVEIPLEVIYEDKHMLAVNKAAGMVVHPGAGTRDDTLVHALLAHCKGKLSGVGGVERPGIVHRLDRETSGVILVAKSDLAHRGLAEQFKERELQKEYLTLVTGAPGLLSGSIKKLIGRNKQHRHKMAAIDEEDESGRGREAHTDWVVVESFGKIATLMRCTIHTGRTHQIRVHMKALGHVVLGDEIYGWKPDSRLPKQPERVMLHAEHIVVAHPISGKVLDLKAPLPADFEAQVAQLRKLTRNEEKRKMIAAEPVKKKGKPAPPPAHVREQ